MTCANANEVEALFKEFRRAVAGASLAEGLEPGIRAGVEAVARAVRAQDAARSSEMDPDVLGVCFRGVDADLPDIGKMLRSAFAAKGRTIAALEARAEQAEGQARSNLAKAEHWRKEARASESALATLRQAVMKLAASERKTSEVRQAIWREVYDAMNVTPSEHPDTTTLREIREGVDRIRNMLLYPNVEWDEVRRDILRETMAMLGDSGPSGGVETSAPEHRTCYDGGPHEAMRGEPSRCVYGEHDMEGKPLDCVPAALVQPSTPPDTKPASEPKPTPDDCTVCDGKGSHRLPDTMGVARDYSCGRCGGSGEEPKQTPEEDVVWRGQHAARLLPDGTLQSKNAGGWYTAGPSTPTFWWMMTAKALARELVRLRDEPRRAAEAMRERCAQVADTPRTTSCRAVARLIRALPLLKDSGPERSEKEGSPGVSPLVAPVRGGSTR